MDFKSLSSRCRRRGHLTLAVLALLGLTGAGVAWAAAHHSSPSVHGHGHGFGGFRLHADFLVDRALRKVDASDEQRRQVEAIVGRAFDAQQALHTGQQALHQEVEAILTAEKVDRARLEMLRAHHLQAIEQGSRRITQAVADISDVLTVEQRRELVNWLKERHQ